MHTPHTYHPNRIAESVLGHVDWIDVEHGYLPHCPGETLHTNRNGKRDCEVFLRGIPTVACFHTSCAGPVSDLNKKLRRAFWLAERGGQIEQWHPTAADLATRRKRQEEDALKKRAAAALTCIVADFGIDEMDFRESSPIRLDGDPADDWRLLLGLFPQDDTVWIGDTRDSAPENAPEWKRRQAAQHFRKVSEWLKERRAPGNFTCPSVFKNNSHSRSNENVIARRFLVVESDPQPEKKTGLSRSQMLALIQWLRRSIRLRAVVCTGGKSLHGWFDDPEPRFLDELRTILPALQCDEALFKASQPVRLPGAFRADKGRLQSLIWFGGAG